MKQGLSLRVSQHLALTPQLQQSIRLLQLSTLELSQEVGQMLDDNPFLELSSDESPREEFGLAQADTPVRQDDLVAESAPNPIADYVQETRASAENEAEVSPLSADDGQSWDGDGSATLAPDDSEWGGEARASGNNLDGNDDADVTELARSQVSLQSHLHTQALAFHLSAEDRAALGFLIESLNDDGYLEDPLPALAEGLAGAELEQLEPLLHHFTVALSLLQSLEPAGVGARDLAECLTLQLKALLAVAARDPAHQALRATLTVALRVCAQPMDLLARRDIKRLVQMGVGSDALVRGGQLDVGAESNDGQVEIVVRADGPRIVLDAEMRAALTGTQGEAVITPRAAAAYLVQALVAEGGGIVQVSDPEDSVLLFGAVFKAG